MQESLKNLRTICGSLVDSWHSEIFSGRWVSVIFFVMIELMDSLELR